VDVKKYCGTKNRHKSSGGQSVPPVHLIGCQCTTWLVIGHFRDSWDHSDDWPLGIRFSSGLPLLPGGAHFQLLSSSFCPRRRRPREPATHLPSERAQHRMHCSRGVVLLACNSSGATSAGIPERSWGEVLCMSFWCLNASGHDFWELVCFLSLPTRAKECECGFNISGNTNFCARVLFLGGDSRRQIPFVNCSFSFVFFRRTSPSSHLIVFPRTKDPTPRVDELQLQTHHAQIFLLLVSFLSGATSGIFVRSWTDFLLCIFCPDASSTSLFVLGFYNMGHTCSVGVALSISGSCKFCLCVCVCVCLCVCVCVLFLSVNLCGISKHAMPCHAMHVRACVWNIMNIICPFCFPSILICAYFYGCNALYGCAQVSRLVSQLVFYFLSPLFLLFFIYFFVSW